MRSCPSQKFYDCRGIWSKLERWKSSVSGCLMNWPPIKKKHHFSSVIFSYSIQQWTIFWPDCDTLQKVDFTQQPAMTSAVGGPRRNSKALTKAKLVPNKGPWSLFGGLMLVWSTTAFWILAKPLHSRSMISKSIRHTKNCNACSQHWSTERAQFSSRTAPNCISHNPHQSLQLLQACQQLFAGKTLPQPPGGRK